MCIFVCTQKQDWEVDASGKKVAEGPAQSRMEVEMDGMEENNVNGTRQYVTTPGALTHLE